MTRKLSTYEQTHLARFDKSDIDIDQYGEMPVEYITGKVEFCDKIFSVNQDVLIPRIETEELINIAFEKTQQLSHHLPPTAHRSLLIADVGCGCGAIGICLADRCLTADIPFELYMSDVSAPAIEVAKQNSNQLLPTKQDHFHIFTSNLLDGYPQDKKFDLLIANLPYIPSARIDSLESSVKDFEPHLALDGGEQGLTLVSKFAQQAKDIMPANGMIILEIDYTHDGEVIRQSCPDYQVEMIFDQFQRQRFAILTKTKTTI